MKEEKHFNFIPYLNKMDVKPQFYSTFNKMDVKPSLANSIVKKKGKSTPHAWLPPSLGGAPWFIERSSRRWGAVPPLVTAVGGSYPRNMCST